MKTKSLALSGSGLVQHICDLASCGKPIYLAWQGPDGEYCSNHCLELALEYSASGKDVPVKDEEKKKKKVIESDEAAPAKKKKKKTKPAVEEAPKKKKKKVSKDKAESSGRSNFPGESVIRVVKKENPFRGNRAEYHKLIKDGMTVDAFLKAMVAKEYGASTRPLQRAVEAKLIKIAA